MHTVLKTTQNQSAMTSSILAIWRAIVSIAVNDMTHAQCMKCVNDVLYLAHQLVPYSDDPNISAEMERLTLCGNTWFDQELVYLLKA
jgi:hypothetical protein